MIHQTGRRRRVTAIASFIIGCALMLAPTHAFAADPSLTVAVSDTSQPGSGLNVTLTQFFAPALSKYTHGQLTLRVYPAGELGGEATLDRKLQAGSLDMAVVGVTGVPGVDALYTPWFFKDWKQVREAIDGGYLAKQFATFNSRNTRFIGWLYRNPRNITSNKPIRTPADLVGLKIRTPQFPTMVAVFRAMGTDAVALPFPEVFTSLQSGLVGAQENPVTLIASSKFYEVQKYLDLTQHSYAPYVALVSNTFWSKLTTAQRSEFMAAWKEAQKQGEAYNRSVEAKAIAELSKDGMTVVKPDNAAFITKARSAATKALDSVWGADTVAKIEALH